MTNTAVRPVPAILAALLIVAALAAGGCASTEERTYDVTVRNETTGPLTLWLTKSGEPMEEGWMSPEDYATIVPGRIDPFPGIRLEAGEEAYTGEVTGEFDEGTAAILRVYEGALRMAEILARGSGDRMDVVLDPGSNSLVIAEENGDLVVRRSGEQATAAAAAE